MIHSELFFSTRPGEVRALGARVVLPRARNLGGVEGADELDALARDRVRLGHHEPSHTFQQQAQAQANLRR